MKIAAFQLNSSQNILKLVSNCIDYKIYLIEFVL